MGCTNAKATDRADRAMLMRIQTLEQEVERLSEFKAAAPAGDLHVIRIQKEIETEWKFIGAHKWTSSTTQSDADTIIARVRAKHSFLK